jgi:uncharacterized iron-regulated protein
MMNHLTRLATLMTILALAACAGQQPKPQITHNVDDPLIGRIFHKDGPQEIDASELYQRMADSDVIYLGENHDNVHQHRIQLDTIRQLVEMGRKPLVGFEFFGRGDTPLLNQHQASDDKYHDPNGPHGNAAETLLRQQLGWGKNRDEDWAHLYPILKYAREQKLPVFGADLSASLRKQISKEGYAGLNGVEKLLVPATDFKDDDYRALMLESFTRAHCGWGDEKYLGKLYDAWLARNEAMARSIIAMHEETPDQPVVMILGGGHTEYNMAVVERIAHLKPGLRQLNLRLRTVGEKPSPVEAYFEPLTFNDKSFGAPFDYQWFTARMPEREDLCAAFLKHKNKHAPSGKDSDKASDQ